MRDLDLTNPHFAKPKNLCSVGAIIPLVLSLSAIALVSGANRDSHIINNPIIIFLITIASLSFLLIFIPRLFNWNWAARYFFISSLEMGSLALLGTIPWLCFLLYATISFPIRIIFFCTYLAIILSLSKKFLVMYLEIKKSSLLINYLYQKDGGKDFYIQKNDIYLIEKKFKLKIYPAAKYFVISTFFAFSTIPFAKMLSNLIGLPFPHIFLGIFSIPIDMMALAFVTRGWFVFFHIPKHAGLNLKNLFVDMNEKNKL